MSRLALLLATVVLLAVPVAAAKNFDPGDLRLCGATRCAPVETRATLEKLGELYYGPRAAARTAAPRLGAPYLELRFRNGYVTGIVAGARLDRFLSYGVHLEKFKAGRWYAVPASAALELRRLAGTKIAPLVLGRAALARFR